MKFFLSLATLCFVTLLGSCKEIERDASEDATSDNFTVAGIAKTWTSNCETGTEPITQDTYYKTTLTLDADGYFHSQIYWYTDSLCVSYNLLQHAIYGLYGTYTLGDFVAGSTTTKTLNFTINLTDYNGSDLMTFDNATRAAFNTDCGGTSPFFGGAHAVDGGHVDTSHMTCMHETFPNSGVNKNFSNIATFDGTNLTIGAYDDANIPGAFPGGSVASTATIVLH